MLHGFPMVSSSSGGKAARCGEIKPWQIQGCRCVPINPQQTGLISFVLSVVAVRLRGLSRIMATSAEDFGRVRRRARKRLHAKRNVLSRSVLSLALARKLAATEKQMLRRMSRHALRHRFARSGGYENGRLLASALWGRRQCGVSGGDDQALAFFFSSSAARMASSTALTCSRSVSLERVTPTVSLSP